jgi:hypothetical protein
VRVPLAPLVALAAVALAAPAAGAAPVFSAARPIVDVVANGHEVAVLVNCRHVTVLRSDGKRRRALLPARTLCGGTPRFRPGPLAFDGFRVAFRWEGGGNNLEGLILRAPAARGARPVAIDTAEEVEGAEGDHFDGPRGGAGLNAYLRVRDDGTDVRLVTTTGFRTIETIDAEASLLAARGRRVVVATGGQVRVLDRDGATRATASSTGVLAAAVLGERVLLLRPKRIDVVEADGTAGPSIALAGTARAASSFGATLVAAMYTDGGRVHAVRLAGGRDRIVARVPAGTVRGSGLGRASIGSDGILYARNRDCRAPGACRGELHRVLNRTIARAFARRAGPDERG